MTGATRRQRMSGTNASAMIAAVCASPAWHALWTRSHCEQLVHDQLVAKGFDLFLPMIDRWSRRGGLRHLIRIPMFPGDVFLHGVVDKASYVEVVKARGLVRVLGERWDRLATGSDGGVGANPRNVDAPGPPPPHPPFRGGPR